MRLTLLTGRANAVRQAGFERIHGALRGDKTLLVVVPAQLTLQAELDILGGPDSPGSFRLQVLSPGRLCQRVFEQAGWPKGARIDEQGRVMLLHRAALHQKKRLTWYRRAALRKGFAEKALGQIEAFKQAGIDPERLLEMAEAQGSSALRKKLQDLAILYQDYEGALKGRFLDGEDELREAVARLSSAPLVQDADVFAYGFDTISASLANLLVALAGSARELTLCLALEDGGRDKELYAPIRRSVARLTRLAEAQGVPLAREVAKEMEGDGSPEIRHLSMALGGFPAEKWADAPRTMQLGALKNPQDEAEFAAALVRNRAMDKNWRWRDIALCCQTLNETYEGALRRAFAQADVPLFLPGARRADRHPAAQCLLSALRVVTRGWQSDDMVDYLRCGMTGIGDDTLDLLVNHILRYGLRGKALKNPLRLIDEAQAPLERARAQAAEPLLHLEARTKKQSDTNLVLGAIFEMLEELSVCAQIEAQQEALIALGQREWAMEGAQVWNKILAALDQMHELLSGEGLTLNQAHELLQRALSVAQVRPLPQSGDAVLCGSFDHMKSRPVKALLVLGLSDAGAPSESGLLSEKELDQLDPAERLSAALSPADRQRMALLSLKAALSLTDSYLFLSHPASDAKGMAQKPGVLVQQVRRIFPALKAKGGLHDEAAMLRLRLNAPQAARSHLAGYLNASPDEPYLWAVKQALGGPERATAKEPDALPAPLAERLFAQVEQVSVSRLERFVECPYKHFARYALRPEEFHEFTLTPQDAGSFYHEAMERFIAENGARLSELSPEQSMARMDSVTGELMEEISQRALGEGALARAQGEELRRIARRAAATVVNQLKGSKFLPKGIEISFGQGEPGIAIDGGAQLMGRIDRVDEWRADGEQYLRVIDYKTGGRSLSLSELYHGLSMQLLVYLAAAVKQQGGKPAGAFFFNISDKPIDTDARDPALVERERRKALRLKGLVLKDEKVLSAMAEQPDEAMAIRDSKVQEDEFNLLIEHTLGAAGEAFGRLRAGEIQKSPALHGQRSACDHCEHAVLCQRELQATTKKLPSYGSKEVMERLRGERE